MKIRIFGIVPDSITDGPGFRCGIFTQGCLHHCKGCHNPESWAMDGGTEYDTVDIIAMWDKNPLLKGITLSGGDPFYQPKPCLELAKAAHAKGLDVFAFTGYTFEEIMKVAETDADVAALLRECDFLVDGPFILEQRSLELLYRGSANQRILDMKKSLAEGKAVWAEEYRD